MAESPGRLRRRSPRLSFEGPVLLTTAAGGHQIAELRDISATGLGVLLESPLAKGTECRLTMELSTGVQLALGARVMHSGEPGTPTGMQITEIDAESERTYRQLVRDVEAAHQAAFDASFDELASSVPSRRRPTRDTRSMDRPAGPASIPTPAQERTTAHYRPLDASHVPPSLLSADAEAKIRERTEKASVIDPTLEKDRQRQTWSIIDRASGKVHCAGFDGADDAVFHARAREYVKTLLHELDRLRRLVGIENR